jgi:hypothetical protein
MNNGVENSLYNIPVNLMRTLRAENLNNNNASFD